MTPKNVIDGLEAVRDKLGPILEYDAADVINAARGQVWASRRNKFWGFKIEPDNSLRFLRSEVRESLTRPDVFCHLLWSGQSARPVHQELVLRVWSLDPDLVYRHGWDGGYIRKKFIKTKPFTPRVMLRVHFDLANDDQEGPQHHIQVGGNARPEEWCWHPQELKLPRMLHAPMDLVTLCQMVAANFFPDQYLDIRDQPSWKEMVKVCEQALWKDFHEECLSTVSARGKPTLLDHFWEQR